MRNRIRFGILGTSTIAEKSMIPAIKESNKAELYMIGSRTKKKASVFCKKFSCEVFGDYNQVLKNKQVDAVYISLPPNLHEKWILEAVKNGKHVICEKPAALTTKSAKKIVSECKKNQVYVIENFAFKLHPQHTKVSEMIKSNIIGNINYFYGNYSFNLKTKPNNFRLNKKLGGGVLNDVACYLISASRFIFNENPISIFCNLEYSNKIDTSGSIFLKYHNKTAIFFFSYKDYFQSYYNIAGENGIIQVERAFNVDKDMNSVITIKKNDRLKQINVKPYNKFKILVDEFCDQINNLQVKNSDFGEALIYQARIIENAKKSARLNRVIKLNYVRSG